MTSYFQNLVNQTKIEELVAKYFNTEAIVYDASLEGQAVSEARQVVLGPWAGPVAEESRLVHEMAHLVEIDKPRMQQPVWGLKYGSYWEIHNKSGWEMHTDQGVQREIRTIAIQVMMLKHYQIPHTIQELISGLDFISGYCLYRRDLSYEQRPNAIENDIKQRAECLTIQWFDQEWNERAAYIRRRLKTNKRQKNRMTDE